MYLTEFLICDNNVWFSNFSGNLFYNFTNYELILMALIKFIYNLFWKWTKYFIQIWLYNWAIYVILFKPFTPVLIISTP